MPEAQTQTRRRSAKKTTKKKAAPKKDPLQEAEAAAKKKAGAKSAEQQEADNKIAEAKKAAAAAEKAKKEAKRAEEKAKAEAEKAAKKATVEKSLVKTAKDINGRIDVIDRAQKRTDDHRLALALDLAVAKEQCREGSIKFREWCDENIKQSYETTRKLLPIGEAERDEEGAGVKMLEDLRKGAADRNKKLRDKKKDGKKADAGAKKVSTDKLREMMDELEPDEWEKFMETQASTADMKLVKEDDAPVSTGDNSSDDDEGKTSTGDRIKRLFGKLSASEKMVVGGWMAEELGCTLTPDEGEEESEES